MKETPLIFKNENQQIVGILHLPRIKKAPLIIMVHGWSGHRLGARNAFFVKFAREFQKNDFAVLRFDFRGSGDSAGKFEDQTTTSMLSDLDVVTNQISRFPEIDKNKIALIGYSQGGYISVLKAIKDNRIKCLVLWAGRISEYKDFSSKACQEEINRKGFILVGDYKVTLKYLTDSMKYHLLDSMRNFKVPICLIYGEADQIVRVSEGFKIFKRARGPKQLKILKDLNHIFSGEENQKEVLKISLTWLNRYLKDKK